MTRSDGAHELLHLGLRCGAVARIRAVGRPFIEEAKLDRRRRLSKTSRGMSVVVESLLWGSATGRHAARCLIEDNLAT
jgi:hypothetical protein